jgi:hypothetical protein
MSLNRRGSVRCILALSIIVFFHVILCIFPLYVQVYIWTSGLEMNTSDIHNTHILNPPFFLAIQEYKLFLILLLYGSQQITLIPTKNTTHVNLQHYAMTISQKKIQRFVIPVRTPESE